uniref:Uncharacterized protein n=1 Tax=Rhodococcus sp. NS1 TaxID=402236 RepID=A0A097SPJ2_9NOCA|nr:hypothetical protein LRS1606.10 [Rhodococcus sp. NS1]
MGVAHCSVTCRGPRYRARRGRSLHIRDWAHASFWTLVDIRADTGHDSPAARGVPEWTGMSHRSPCHGCRCQVSGNSSGKQVEQTHVGQGGDPTDVLRLIGAAHGDYDGELGFCRIFQASPCTGCIDRSNFLALWQPDEAQGNSPAVLNENPHP